jgi:hypothetical protein
MKEIVLNAAVDMASFTLQQVIAALLASIKENNDSETYEAALRTLNGSMQLLHKLAEKTKTKLDDKAIDVFLIPTQSAASTAGITL